MSLKSFGAKILAKKTVKKIQSWTANPVVTQQRVFSQLISKAKNTQFGIDHHFTEIVSPSDFAEKVPIRDYEDLRGYIDGEGWTYFALCDPSRSGPQE